MRKRPRAAPTPRGRSPPSRPPGEERPSRLGAGAGLGLSLRPALEQTAKGERGHLARRQRTYEPLGGRIGHAVGAHEARPAVAVRLAHLFLY
jgi:hypothetical protein